MQLNNKAKFADKHLEFRAQLATVHRATAAVYLANLFPFRLVELGELVPVAVDLVERGRVFWQRWRWNWPGRYRGLFVRFVATVNTGRNGCDHTTARGRSSRDWTGTTTTERVRRLKVGHVSARGGQNRFHRRYRRPSWLRWRRCTHIFIIFGKTITTSAHVVICPGNPDGRSVFCNWKYDNRHTLIILELITLAVCAFFFSSLGRAVRCVCVCVLISH